MCCILLSWRPCNPLWSGHLWHSGNICLAAGLVSWSLTWSQSSCLLSLPSCLCPRQTGSSSFSSSNTSVSAQISALSYCCRVRVQDYPLFSSTGDVKIQRCGVYHEFISPVASSMLSCVSFVLILLFSIHFWDALLFFS